MAVFTALGASAAEAVPSITRIRGLASNGPTARYPIPSADGAQIDLEQEVILVRWQGVLYAFNLSCPHQRTSLKWLEEDSRFQCPKHKSKYTPDGTFISGRATRGMDRFPLTIDGKSVVVDLSGMYKEDKDPAGWHAAMVKLP